MAHLLHTASNQEISVSHGDHRRVPASLLHGADKRVGLVGSIDHTHCLEPDREERSIEVEVVPCTTGTQYTILLSHIL